MSSQLPDKPDQVAARQIAREGALKNTRPAPQAELPAVPLERWLSAKELAAKFALNGRERVPLAL